MNGRRKEGQRHEMPLIWRSSRVTGARQVIHQEEPYFCQTEQERSLPIFECIYGERN
jgi:hypothetical protein